jgi:outer membrane protein OmpA-like peptidoglycan-associated protein
MNHDRRRLMAALGLCLSAALPAAAQTDVENSKDYPGLNRMPGFYITVYEDEDVGTFDFLVADDNYTRVGGRCYFIQYTLKEGVRNPGATGVGLNYRNAIMALGGAPLAESIGDRGGYVSASWKVNDRSIWVQADVNNGGASYTLNIVEAALRPDVEFTAAEMGRVLDEKGAVAVRGILFETGQSTIKPESAALLAQIAELLTSDEELKLEIQAHTDNVGAKPANLTLSQGRAAAVKDYLVKTHQIPAARLTTAGFGDTKPVGDNGTAEGKALNRRVELVKRS